MSVLKALSVLSIVAYVCASPLSPEEAKKQMYINAAICKEEHHVEGSLKDIFRSDQAQPDNVNCFLECSFKKNGLIKDGAVNRENYLHALAIHTSPDAAKHIADACIKDADVSSCGGVGKFHMCAVKKAKELAATSDVDGV